MHQEDREIFKLKKQLTVKEEEYKRERTMLQQKIELLTSEIAQYQEKQIKNRQLNESIIMSYRQNQSFREQYNIKELQNICNRHQEQLRRLKQSHKDERKKIDDQIVALRTENQTLKIQMERLTLEAQKKLADAKNNWEQKMIQKEEDLNTIWNQKIAFLNEKLRQSEEMCRMYRDQIQMRLSKDRFPLIQNHDIAQYESQEMQNGEFVQTIKSKKSDLLIGKYPKKPAENLSSLHLRINRALAQINPNSGKLEQKIRQINSRYN